MKIDFNALKRDSGKGVLDPTKIFDILPEKDDKYDGYLRDVQAEVLNAWYLEARDQKDTVIKMNTGSGKTVVGLLILQSYLNEKKGPCAYVVPDNYLLEQVKKEAVDLGIKYSTSESDIDFLMGNSILIVNMHKLFNGHSVFGVKQKKIPINCLVVDDAHTCTEIASDQASLSIPSDQNEYTEIFNLVKDAIKAQSESTLLEIETGSPTAYQSIPFWTWINKSSEILNIIHSMGNADGTAAEKDSYFKWPLIKDYLPLAESYISAKEVLVTLPYVPIEKIPSFIDAEHRVFMSATIEDDTKLIEHLDVNEEYKLISPKKANDIGDRLILIPQAKNNKITDNDMKDYITSLSKENNVVVLVPSYRRSEYWNDSADVIIRTGDELKNTIQQLKEGHVGLVVMVNRYDGIDLPKKACVILVIDSLPSFRSLKDENEQFLLKGTAESDAKNIRIIEQGMGRAVRSKDDYCVVFIMNNVLITQLYINNSIQYFSNSTKKQLELSDLVREKIVEDNYGSVISSVIDRDPNWISASREYIADVKYSNQRLITESNLAEKKAYYFAANKNYEESIGIMQTLVNNSVKDIKTGYLKYKLAKVTHFINQEKAQMLVKSANFLNNQLPRPISGIEYNPLKITNSNQAQNLNKFIHDTFDDKNQYLLKITEIVEKLSFVNVSSNVFEQTIKELGQYIGLTSQRPEKDYGKGPDNLWLLNNNFVIECKNEATSAKINKRDCNQLNGSIQWFKNEYSPQYKLSPIMIHPSLIFERAASPNPDIRIINSEMLEKLRTQFKLFSEDISNFNFDATGIERSLQKYNFSEENFHNHYTLPFK